MSFNVENMIILGGIGHFALSVGSLFIPRLLKWSEVTAKFPTLFRQLFWTYSGYILGIHLFFGFISIWGSAEMTKGTFLATSITGFITLYWLMRIIIQLFIFDTSVKKKGWIFRIGEICLMICFILFVGIYGYAFWNNITL